MPDREFDFHLVGGTRLIQGPNEVWNFGFRRASPLMKMSMPDLDNVAPHLRGSWDGKTTINLWEFTKQVDGYWPKGEFMPAQKQPRGTCVSRGATAAANILQCVQIVQLGMSYQFKPVSHAVIYGEARELGGIRGYDDGAVGSDAAKAFQKWGCVYQEEAHDADYNSDDLAVEYGAKWVPSEVKTLGADNLVKEIVKVTTCQQAADLVANGYTITIASDQGFSMTRDHEGVCRAQGSWMHQMAIASVHVLPSGRKVFGIIQSWGKNTPDGPLLAGCPDHVFGAEWDTVARMLRQEDSMGLANLQGWPRQYLHHMI